MKTIPKFGYETTTNYNKVWSWLKTQRVIGTNSSGTRLRIFYRQDERGNILFLERGYLNQYSHITKENFIECCKKDKLRFIIPNEAYTNGVCLSQLINRMSEEKN